MVYFRDGIFSKILAVFLCVLIAAEVQTAFSGQETPLMRFANARQDYIDGNFKGAIRNLEEIIKVVDGSRPEFRDFIGHVFLLLGASSEKLGEGEAARGYYRRAAELLGQAVPRIEGLNLSGLVLLDQVFTKAAVPLPQGVPVETDPQLAKYMRAKDAYSFGDIDNAKNYVESLLTDLSFVTGRDVFKGETYLLAGAIYERLRDKKLAVSNFCKAKSLLGEGRTFEGLDLGKLEYYRVECPGVGGAIASERAVPVTRTRGRGTTLGTVLMSLLLTAVVGGLVWFLFFSKYSPFKTGFNASCFTTKWEYSVVADYIGPKGTVTLTPSNQAPNPNENNNWEDQVTYTLSATGGGTLERIVMNWDVTIGGGDNAMRHDIISVDGVEKLNVTNTFSEPCSRPGTKKYTGVYTRMSTGTFTIKHKVELSNPARIAATMEATKK